MAELMNEIVIYQSADNSMSLEVKTDPETVWLSQKDMSQLFDTSTDNIGLHLKNIYADKELSQQATTEDFSVVQREGNRDVSRSVKHYNLDAIIAVGYRVNSKQATRFRIWATSILRQYLVSGIAINQKRLDQLEMIINILHRSSDELIAGVADVLDQYAGGLFLLESYDQKTLQVPKGTHDLHELGYQEARELIDRMPYRKESNLFGAEKDNSFKSALATIYQTFGGEDLYPSVQEKAANLLYLIIKNHPFNDGNKRIAATMFVYFLSRNNALNNKNGTPLIANNTLAAITLMIALSRPDEKEMMCLLVMNMLRDEIL